MADTAGTTSMVVEMLKEDHEKVKKLFEEFESSEGRERADIAKKAMEELEIHADLEERLVYPAIRAEIDDSDLMNEAIEEHHLVHVLIAELKRLKPQDERFSAKFTVLGELVKHHIEEEEGEILPKAEQSDVDWESLEAKVVKRKETLLAKGTSGRKSRPASKSGSRRKSTR